jgi:hypothetical protein
MGQISEHLDAAMPAPSTGCFNIANQNVSFLPEAL